jgi:hypothetical protein
LILPTIFALQESHDSEAKFFLIILLKLEPHQYNILDQVYGKGRMPNILIHLVLMTGLIIKTALPIAEI